MDSVMKGLMGQCPLPQNFWAEQPLNKMLKTSLPTCDYQSVTVLNAEFNTLHR